MMLAFTLLLATAVPSAPSTPLMADSLGVRGARTPAFAPDGRLVISLQGHLLLQRAGSASWVPLTAGAAWDRDPAWTPDGSAIVFASDRGGSYDLWRLEIGTDGRAGALTRLTTTPQAETAPAVASDGRIVFLRGSGNATRLWIREADGAERRLTTGSQTERAPRLSRDGRRLAWIVLAEGGRRVQVAPLPASGAAAGSVTRAVTINSDATAEDLAWAPDDRVAVSTRTGIQVMPASGGYANLATTTHGQIAWSPDGATFAVVPVDEPTIAYNGDPDRGSDRSAVVRPLDASALARGIDQLQSVAAPRPIGTAAALPLTLPSIDRAQQNAERFDRVWEQSTRLYFSAPEAAPRRAQWEAIRTRLRPRALAATTDDALDRVLHEALMARPVLREPASGRAAVSSAHPVATEAGLEMLRRGGNVVDAAVAVSFALGVVEPDASGIGGYGEMLIARKGAAAPTLIEFMSRVPEEGGLTNTGLLVNGRYPADGPVLVNVPGTVAGMYTAWQKYGSHTIPWAELLAPAIRAARNGYEVSQGLATTLATEREHFAKYEGSRALFFRNGEPLLAGDTLRNPDLAWVLEQIAQRGADGFYKGDVAEKWVADLRGKGNAMKLSDLARYFAPEREPVRGSYRGQPIFSSAPPVSGGAELVARLNLLEQFPAPKLYRDDPATAHAVLTAWFLVPSSRNRIADPALWPVDVAPIISKDTAVARWRCYAADRAIRPDQVRGDSLSCLPSGPAKSAPSDGALGDAALGDDALGDDARSDDALGDDAPCGPDHAREMSVCHAAGTTAFAVADNDGNMVAVTQTLGTWGGNFYVTPGLGFLSNDKLTSYGTDPTQYGSRLPFARHGSTLAPTIAYRNGKPFAAVSAAGNAWITSAVYQSLLGMLDANLGPQQALELPRILPGGGGAPAPTGRTANGGANGNANGGANGRTPAPPPGYALQLEDGFAPEVTARLRSLGYSLSFVSLRGEVREGYGAAVRVDGKVVTAGADPRRAGAAGAIK